MVPRGERYVVRAGDGVLVTSTEDAVTFHYENPVNEKCAYDRDGAVNVLREVRKEFPDYGPFRLVRLIPKRKPKTPREVFVTMSADGVPRDAWLLQWDAEHEVAAHRSGTRYDRVVRYVLAEGE
jgi:hypothetical protein